MRVPKESEESIRSNRPKGGDTAQLLRKHAIFLARLLVAAGLGARTAAAEQAANAPAAKVTPDPPVPPPAELQNMLAACEAYQALSPAAKAQAARPAFPYPQLSRTAAQAWRGA